MSWLRRPLEQENTYQKLSLKNFDDMQINTFNNISEAKKFYSIMLNYILHIKKTGNQTDALKKSRFRN